METASRADSYRPWLLLTAATGALCLSLLAGCGGSGGGGDSGSSSPSQGRFTAVANFPRPSNRSLRGLIANLPQGPELAPSVSLLNPGFNRFGFALFDRGRRQIGDLEVVLYLAKGLDETAHGPFPARYEPLEVRPQYLSKTSAQNPDMARSVYVAKIPFPTAGTYLVSAVTKLDRKLVAASPAQIVVQDPGPVPKVGERAIRTHSPTNGSVPADVNQIDARIQTDDMQHIDLYDSLKHHHPIVLLFATSGLCLSRVCGPVTDIAEEVKSEYGGRADFIHVATYKDNDVKKGLSPQVRRWGLSTEPFLFTINRHGVVVSRIEGAFSVPELKAAVRKALH